LAQKEILPIVIKITEIEMTDVDFNGVKLAMNDEN
jgi:hypothetical protein